MMQVLPVPDVQQQRYRPEIDGLRALAVVAVVINHLDARMLPSGYLGVDIFFVISGYVITASLAQRPVQGWRDFVVQFYGRRLRRLLPALLVFVLVSAVLICLFNPDPADALRTGLAALVGVSNLYLLRQATDYFAPDVALNPYTHTWSLGVEEQFYLLYPLLVWLSGLALGKQGARRRLAAALLVLSAISLVAFVGLYPGPIKGLSPEALIPVSAWVFVGKFRS